MSLSNNIRRVQLITSKYEFSDRTVNGPWILNITQRNSKSYIYQEPSRGIREAEKLRRMVFRGEVVMLQGLGSPGSLFIINGEGKLVCRDVMAFEHHGAENVIREYHRSVSCRNYSRTNGKPRATNYVVYSTLKSPDTTVTPPTAQQETFGTINSKMAGRLLAAGGMYNQNPQMFAETARQLGGEASQGFSQVLNEQTAGSLMAMSSVLMVGRMAVHPTSVVELEKLKSYLGTYKGEKSLLQNIDVVKMDYIKRPAVERMALRREFDKAKKNFLKSIVNDPKVQSRLNTDDLDRMSKGNNPLSWDVHHKLPLDDSGTNDFSNLVLISKSPEHAMFTTAQQKISRAISAGGPTEVLWPVPKGVIYP